EKKSLSKRTEGGLVVHVRADEHVVIADRSHREAESPGGRRNGICESGDKHRPLTEAREWCDKTSNRDDACKMPNLHDALFSKVSGAFDGAIKRRKVEF